jgi:hypothetical protein
MLSGAVLSYPEFEFLISKPINSFITRNLHTEHTLYFCYSYTKIDICAASNHQNSNFFFNILEIFITEPAVYATLYHISTLPEIKSYLSIYL